MKRLAISSIRAAGHAVLWPLEQSMLSKADTAPPPVFIIGAPRSGTSLLYELMITRFRFAYMSNAAHRFYKTPLAASRIFAKPIDEWQGNFTSSYGHIDGWGAPNEGGWIWQRWLADGDWRDGANFPETSAIELRCLLAGFSHLANAPFLNKNVMHSNRLRLMHRIWPDALFVEVRRDALDNARSIIRAERAEGGPKKHSDEWWSVRPRLAKLYAGKPDSQRAAAQVVGVTQDIAEDIAEIGANRLLSVDYLDMCRNPGAVLTQIAQFLVSNGAAVEDRGTVPNAFPVRPSKPLDHADEAEVTATLGVLMQNETKAKP